MQRAGLEWLFRLLQEPRRLFKRYAVTNSIFLFLLCREFFRIKDPQTETPLQPEESRRKKINLACPYSPFLFI